MTQFDESNPKIVVVFEGEEHGRPEAYQAWLGKWVEKLNQPERFGVILVVHEHDHDEEHERDGEAEDAISRLLNDFRRDYRPLVNKKTLGYAAVFSPTAVKSWEEHDPDIWQNVQTRYEVFSNYMWGIRGRAFTDLEEAKSWILSLENQPPLPLAANERVQEQNVENKATLYYGSTTGTTELVAEKIQTEWQRQCGENLPVLNVSDLENPAELLATELLLLGVPTWNIGKLQDDWEIFFPQLDKTDFSGQRIALFGVGDQYGYPENFQDALGILGHKLRERGAQLLGLWSIAGYEFDYSCGVENGRFLGLAIDEVSQSDLTNARIAQWVTQIREEIVGESLFKIPSS